MPKLFGTDGIRGIANRYPITPEMGLSLGRALAKYCCNKGLFITGRDTRISGPMLENAVISGVLSCGGDALSVGIMPTPGVAYLIKRLNANGGIVISASHNPFEYNGFKPFYKGGEKLSEKEEDRIEALMEDAPEEGADIGKIHSLANPLEYYKRFLLDTLPKDISFNDMNVVLDCANGATYQIAPYVFQELGVNTTTISSLPNGKNINDRCGSQHPEALKNKVLEQKADLGLAFDGDGDRLIAVDEKGNVLTGDQLIAIFARMLKKMGKLENPVVVTTVMSNMGLRKALHEMGIRNITTKVGDRNVVREMKKRGAILGGEESGHIIFLNHHSTGDGIISALQLISALKILDMPLHELSKTMEVFPQIVLNVKVREKPDLSTIPEIKEKIDQIERLLSDKGRILVRYSGTEPVCRIMLEGEDKGIITRYAQEIASLIQDRLG